MTLDPQNPGILFETQSVNLTCNISEAGEANYRWLRNGEELPGSTTNVIVNGNQLYISDLTVVGWNGMCITCQAVAMAAMGSDSLNLTVASKSI